MYCKNCGEKIKEKWKICPSCGFNLLEDRPQPIQQPQQIQQITTKVIIQKNRKRTKNPLCCICCVLFMVLMVISAISLLVFQLGR